jgi:hypothetical protein
MATKATVGPKPGAGQPGPTAKKEPAAKPLDSKPENPKGNTGQLPASKQADPKQAGTKPADSKASQGQLPAAKHEDSKPGSLNASAVHQDPKTSKGAHAPVAKGPVVHVDSFDAKRGQAIDSPRSRQAMKELGIQDADLHLKTADDLKGKFNLADPDEKKAMQEVLEKHESAHKNLLKKISERRKELIHHAEEEAFKKHQQEILKAKQLQEIAIEKNSLMKQLAADPKYQEIEKIRKDNQKHSKEIVAKIDASMKNSSLLMTRSVSTHHLDTVSQKQGVLNSTQMTNSVLLSSADPKSPKKNEPVSPKKGETKKEPSVAKPGEKSVIEPSKVRINEPHDKTKPELSPSRSQSPGKRPLTRTRTLTSAGNRQLSEKRLKLDVELRNSSILAFLEKSAHHKDRLDVSLLERTKQDLARDKQRMKELMKKQKFDLIEMAQKRSASAYKPHEAPANAKTRMLDYLAELNKPVAENLQHKYQKEMEHIMNYEISLKVALE